MIIGVTGPIASGKSVFVDELVKRGFVYHRISDEVREEAKSLGIPIERTALQDLGNKMREKHGNGYWAQRLMKKMRIGKNYVIDGIRNPGEIIALKAAGDFVLVCVDAPEKERFRRIIVRNKDSDPKTIEEVKKIDSRDRGNNEAGHGQQTNECMKLAEHLIINDGTEEELKAKVDKLLKEIV